MSTLKQCDRCKLVEPLEETEGWAIVRAKMTASVLADNEVTFAKVEYGELCHDCALALEKWLETPPPEKFLDPRLENEPK